MSSRVQKKDSGFGEAACDKAETVISEKNLREGSHATSAGYVDSVYCGSGVDGRGLRCVVFLSGCNLRCPFCHNPETLFKRGIPTDSEMLAAKLKRYKSYFRRGGVTLSGGEPFLQKEFALSLMSALKKEGVGCCIETNGQITDPELIAAAESIVCDVKNQEENGFFAYEAFFAECARQKKEVRVTNVLVPGINDGVEKLVSLAALVKKYFGKAAVKFLPFRKLCAEKYAELGIPFPYASLRECEESDVLRAENIVNRL